MGDFIIVKHRKVTICYSYGQSHMPEVGGEGVRVWVISSWLNTVGLLYVIHMGSHICRKLGVRESEFGLFHHG